MLLPLLKETPQEAQIISHQLMLRAGMINQTAAGIYSWLPLGQRVLEKIEKIITEELDAVGCQRITMPTIQPADLWKESGRYDDYGKEMLRIQDRHDRAMLYGPTAEEVVADLGRQFLSSYKQLPLHLYQITTKFRDEIRPRFGVMRGREFLMKDGYSFHQTEADGLREYEVMFNTYMRIFERIFNNIPMLDDPTQMVKPIAVRADSGPIGGNNTHEFQIPAATGESAIYYDKKYLEEKDRTYRSLKDLYTAADELHDPTVLPTEQLRSSRGIEVGQIFFFGDKYSKPLNVQVANDNGNLIYPYMGSYGIGVTRIVGAMIEVSHDKQGIIWPDRIAPFQVGLINLLQDDPSVADTFYKTMTSKGVEVIYDDRAVSPGIKFSEMDLIGVPLHVIIGKSYLQDQKFEVKTRRTGVKRYMTIEEISAQL
jgi:prolyl-tRNA synthetase